MAKASNKSVLNQLAGKTVCFNGKFDWSEEGNLRGMAHPVTPRRSLIGCWTVSAALMEKHS